MTVAQSSASSAPSTTPKLRIQFYVGDKPAMAVSTPWLRVENGWLTVGTDTANQQETLAFFSIAGWEIGPPWKEQGHRFDSFTVSTEMRGYPK